MNLAITAIDKACAAPTADTTNPSSSTSIWTAADSCINSPVIRIPSVEQAVHTVHTVDVAGNDPQSKEVFYDLEAELGALLDQDCINTHPYPVQTEVVSPQRLDEGRVEARTPTADNVQSVDTIAGSNSYNDTTGANSLPPSCVAGSTPHTSGGRDSSCDLMKETKDNKSPKIGSVCGAR